MALDISYTNPPPGVGSGALAMPTAAPPPSVLGPTPSADPTSMAAQQSILSAGAPAPAAAPGGGLFAEIGSNIQARIAANQAVQEQRQLALAAMGQHLATIQRMANAYDAAGDTKTRDLLLADPDGFIKANQAAWQAAHTPQVVGKGQGVATSADGLASSSLVPDISIDAAGNEVDATKGFMGKVPVIHFGAPNEKGQIEPMTSAAAPVVGAPAGLPGGPAPLGTPTMSVAGQPVPAPPAVPGGAVDPMAPRGIRNNNWGNLTPLPHGQQWAGQTGVDKGGYVQFATPADGIKAAVTNLHAYGQNHGINTIAGIAARWAPASAGNDTAAYANTVAKSMGVTPTTVLNMNDPATLNGLTHGIFVAENGAHAMAKAVGSLQAASTAPAVAQGAQPAPQTAPGVVAPGTVFQPGIAQDQILTANQVPNGQPGYTYKKSVDGSLTPIPPAVTETDFNGQGATYMGGAPHIRANQLAGDLNALASTISTLPPGALTTQQATNAALSAITHANTVRPVTVDEFKQSQGLGEQANAIISRTFSNGGETITPDMLKQMYRMTHLATKQATDQDAASLAPVVATAQKYGYDSTPYASQHPNLPTVPASMQDPIPPAPQRKVGATYWGPRGPGVWTGKGWRLQ